MPTWCTHARILNYTADSEGTSISWVHCWEFEFDICILYTVAHMADIFLKPKEEKWAQKLLIPRRKRGPSTTSKNSPSTTSKLRLYVFLPKDGFYMLAKKKIRSPYKKMSKTWNEKLKKVQGTSKLLPGVYRYQKKSLRSNSQKRCEQ